MDSAISAAARALTSGDALLALNFVSLRDDPPALALRGIAMAQLGDVARARLLLQQAVRGFSPRETFARALCTIAQAEIALVSRDLGWPSKRLAAARRVLELHGDRANAAHARQLEARYLLLTGRVDDAEHLAMGIDSAALPPASRATHELVVAGIAVRRLRIKDAKRALARAARVARDVRISSLEAEIDNAVRLLDAPAARLMTGGEERTLRIAEVETTLASGALVIDACRRLICRSGLVISLATRPVLLALARALAETWPGDCSRAMLLFRAFRARQSDESHRARLRVEIGRLRKAMLEVAGIEATKEGFRLAPRGASNVVVVAPLADEAHASVLALLSDGEAWSSSSLALALGASQRTVQRALDGLLAGRKVVAIGNGRARRWMAPPIPGFPTTLLLTAALPGG